jgi:hypothetical protein
MGTLTREQYREKHEIKVLPILVEGIVTRRVKIPDTPFCRIKLDNDFSILVPEESRVIFGKGNRLSIKIGQRDLSARVVNIVRRGGLTEGTVVNEAQIIPNTHWNEESSALIEDSRNNSENVMEVYRWKRYQEGREPIPPPPGDSDWFEKLERAVSPEGLSRR